MNYRKICQEYYGYTDQQMLGMDVHHKDGNHSNNDPKNLQLLSPEEHKKIHNHEFVLWAREGARLGNEAFRKRLREQGQTAKELAYKEKRIEACKAGLHRVPHSEDSKRVISQKKKLHLQDKTNHPMWGNTTYKVTDPEGNTHIVNGGWKEWCKGRGLCPSNLRAVALGKRKHCKGWTAEIL